jgi:hypothetical protein
MYQERNIQLIINTFKLSFYYLENSGLNTEISVAAINYINKNVEENFIIDLKTKITSEYYCINYILTGKKYPQITDMLLYMSNNPECAYPCTSIIMKIIKLKKEESKNLIQILKQDKFKEVIKQIIKIHSCNSAIMTNIIFIIYHLLEHIDTDDIITMINFQTLKFIFLNFQLNCFDVIHEAIIYLIKGILVKKAISSHSNPPTDNDYNDIVHIFSNSLIFIRNKVLSQAMDIMKLSRALFNFLTHIYTITNILNNINPNNAEQTHKVCLELRVSELLIDCLYSFHEKKVFTFIETGFDKFDVNLINTKAIMFRSLFHCIAFIKKLMKLQEAEMVPILSLTLA